MLYNSDTKIDWFETNGSPEVIFRRSAHYCTNLSAAEQGMSHTVYILLA